MSDAPADWVEVHNSNWLHEAQFIRSLLESEGIDVFIPNEFTLGAQPAYGPALGGVRVLVARRDVERAKEILAAGLTDDE